MQTGEALAMSALWAQGCDPRETLSRSAVSILIVVKCSIGECWCLDTYVARVPARTVRRMQRLPERMWLSYCRLPMRCYHALWLSNGNGFCEFATEKGVYGSRRENEHDGTSVIAMDSSMRIPLLKILMLLLLSSKQGCYSVGNKHCGGCSIGQSRVV